MHYYSSIVVADRYLLREGDRTTPCQLARFDANQRCQLASHVLYTSHHLEASVASWKHGKCDRIAVHDDSVCNSSLSSTDLRYTSPGDLCTDDSLIIVKFATAWCKHLLTTKDPAFPHDAQSSLLMASDINNPLLLT